MHKLNESIPILIFIDMATCKQITTRGIKCKNKAITRQGNPTKDGYCTLHHNGNEERVREEKQYLETKEFIKKYLAIESLLVNIYASIRELLSSVGINNNLVTLILDYRIGLFADDSWTFCDGVCLTFNSGGIMIHCDCPNCEDWSEEEEDFSKENNDRSINYELGHCAHCCCDKCICELARKHGRAQRIIIADPNEDCSCWICAEKRANCTDYHGYY